MQSALSLVPVFLSEFIATAMLMFLGCAGCLHWAGTAPSLLQIALNFGLVVMLLIQIFGCVSGGHLNPVVTVAACLCKVVSLQTAAVYVVAQSLGAFAGFGLLKVLTPRKVFAESAAAIGSGNCMIRPNAEMSIGHSLAVEYVASTCLVLICCGVWDKRNAHNQDSLPIRFGLALTALAVVLSPFGACTNPVRSFAPALWHGDLTDQWIYWVAPLTAAVVTPILFKCAFQRPPKARDGATVYELEQPLNHVK